ncbi:hypothetical protein GQ42DRAFT_17092 [Ramicandelaber brevisporus]|nr:hypothetical protein GQ42DRAFT_17092 [Ramicandelaber brevisporus]
MLSIAARRAAYAALPKSNQLLAIGGARFAGSDSTVRGGGGSFSKKEKAIEDQYMHEQDRQKAKALLEKLNKAKQELEKAQKDLESHSAAAPKKN